MAREEKIAVKLVKSNDYQGMYNKLKMEAEALQEKFASIKIGDAKAYAALAKAEKDLATAALNRAKADKVAAEAATAKLKTAQQQAKTDIANAKAQTQLAKSATDLAKAEIARQKAQQASIDTATKQIKQQKEASNAMSAAAKAEKELANAETARQKGIQATINTTTAQIKQQKEATNAQTAYQKQLKATYQAESAQISLEQKKASVLEKSARVYRQLGDEIGKVDKTKAKSYSDIASYVRQIDGLENATIKATGVISNSAGTFQTYTASVQNADGTTQQFKFSVDTTEGTVYKLDQGLRMTASGANAFGNAISKAGKTLLSSLKTLVGYYGIVQSLRYAFKEMKSMSDEMIVYQKITKATADEMDRIRSSSYDVAKKYGQTPTDFLSAAQEMARAGYKERSADMAELAIKTKLVGDITADQASKFLLAVDAGYKFGGSIEKLSMVLDQANEIGNNYATSIDKISEGMTLVASLGAQANVSIEELMAALGTMTAATQRSGSEMARALRFIMLGVLGDTTTEVEEGVTVTAEEVDSLTTALQHYAPAVVEAAKASGKLINPMEAIGALAKAYKEGLLGGEEDLFKIAKELAGQRYYNAFAALIANWDDMYLEMLEKEKEAAGSADAEINVLMSGWTQKLNVLKTTWTEVVNNTVQEGFIKSLIDGATAALSFTGNLANLGTMALGVVTVFKTLTTAMKNYTALNAAAKAFGGTGVSFGTALGTSGKWALGLGIAGALVGVVGSIIGQINAAKEAAIQAAVQEAERQLGKTEETIEKYRSIYNIANRYKELAGDSIVTSAEKSELVSLQEQLNTLLGKQAEAIDLVNGKYSDMQDAINEALQSQLKLTEAEINAAKSKTLTSYLGKSKNTNIILPYDYYTSYFQNIPGFDTYVNELPYDPVNGNFVFNRPDDYFGMIQYAKVISKMMEILNSKGIYGGLESGQYNAIQGVYTSLQEAGVYTLIEMVDAYNEFAKAQDKSKTLSKDIRENNKYAATGFKEIVKVVDELTKSIDAATKAKEDFDNAMKTSKADAMNSYAEAYSTLAGEIKAGRVNSTAYYAAARMLLGNEAFAATGGTSQGVMKALQASGASGSMLDAWDILNGTYVDKEGNEYQGYGLYALLSQTQGIDKSKLLTEKGEVKIQLTAEDWANVSQQWGGIDLRALMYYANAFDQYDITGAATTDVQDALDESFENANVAVDTFTTAMEAATAAAQEFAKAAGGEGESGNGGADTGDSSNGTSSTGLSAEAQTTIAEIKGYYAAFSEQAKQAQEEMRAEAERIIEETSSEFAKEAQKAKEEIDAESARVVEGIKQRSEEHTQAAEQAKEESKAESERVTEETKKRSAEFAEQAKQAKEEIAAQGAKTVENINNYWEEAKRKAEEQSKAKSQSADVATNAVQAATENVQTIIEQSGVAVEVPVEPATGETDVATNAVQKAVESVQNIIEQSGVAAELPVEADTTEAEKEVKEFIDKIPGQVAVGIRTYSIGGVNVYSDTTHNTGGTSPKSFLPDLFAGLHLYASGTQGHPGGPALLNDGNGPELVVDRGRAFIAGGGRPTVMNLHRGAKVFTAGQTSAMLGRGSIPAYAEGTESATPSLAEVLTSILFGDVHRKKDEEDKKEKVGGNSGPKVDKKSYEELKTLMDYILDRIGAAIEEQQEENKLAELQKNLTDALNERTVRYLGEDGKWHWMADASKVQAAQKELDDYQKEYEYNQIVKTWQDIQAAVNTPTGDIDKLLSNILKNGTAPQKKAAEYIQSLLIGNLLQGGSYSGNYAEALTAIQAANAGSPFMPTELSYTLSSLIANTGAHESVGAVTESLMQTASGASVNGTTRGTVYGSPQTFYNYYINGLELGSDQANRPLSDILQDLTVYTNATVH